MFGFEGKKGKTPDGVVEKVTQGWREPSVLTDAELATELARVTANVRVYSAPPDPQFRSPGVPSEAADPRAFLLYSERKVVLEEELTRRQAASKVVQFPSSH